MLLTFGYMEQPNVPRALALAKKEGVKFDIMNTSFFLSRRSFRPAPDVGMPLWQDKLFIAMTKAASDASGFYRLPSNRCWSSASSSSFDEGRGTSRRP